MLGHTIAALRKRQGLSQQALADRIFVVRQTISKWEKNLSVPDADALAKLADALNTSVETLLGAPQSQTDTQPSTEDIAVALGKINDQLAAQNRRRQRIWRIIGWCVAGIVAFQLMLIVFSMTVFSTYSVDVETQQVQQEMMPAPGR